MQIEWRLCAAGCALSMLAAATAGAQGYPDKMVRIVVPQAPGGASDTLARIMGQALGEQWKQTVVIENRAGAGGNIGMEAVARAPADGYTLLMSYVGNQAINGALYRNLPFDPKRDFAPVATLATLPFVAVTQPNTGIASLADLVAAAKRQKINYGSAGNGSVNHLLGEMFNAAAQVSMTHVPYRGAAPAIQDLMGGQIQVVFTSMPSVKGFIDNRSLVPLAVTSVNRAPGYDAIPTIAESGYPGFDVSPWFGLFAPAGTPPAVVNKINADVNALLANRAMIDKFAAQGAVPYPTSPQTFGKILDEDIEKWGKVVRDSGAVVE
jgi:tripartite-type tricarboxylate transporter receptor subunit TctC